MGRLAAGDRSAFDPLYGALRPRAERLARARLGPDGAADVAQTALMKVFARASDFLPGRPCLPWFYAIVANEIHVARRKTARIVLDESAALAVVDEGNTAEARLVLEELERAIDMLDDDGANAIRAMLGRAPLPNVNPVTLRKRISRAYAKLRFLLGGPDVS